MVSLFSCLQTSYLYTFRQVYTVGYATSLISLITAIVVFAAFRLDQSGTYHHLHPQKANKRGNFYDADTFRICVVRTASYNFRKICIYSDDKASKSLCSTEDYESSYTCKFMKLFTFFFRLMKY